LANFSYQLLWNQQKPTKTAAIFVAKSRNFCEFVDGSGSFRVKNRIVNPGRPEEFSWSK